MKFVLINVLVVILYVSIFVIFFPNNSKILDTLTTLHTIIFFIIIGISILKQRDPSNKIEMKIGTATNYHTVANKTFDVALYSFIIIFVLLTLFWAIVEPTTINLIDPLNWATVFANVLIALVITPVAVILISLFKKFFSK